MSRLRQESGLLMVTVVTPLATACLLLVDQPWAARFIETQLIAGTLFTLGSLGVGVTLSSIAVPSPVVPSQLALRLPTLIFLAMAGATAGLGREGLAASCLIAALLFTSVLYRIPGHLLSSRALLVGQFLPMAGTTGIWVLVGVLLAAQSHLVASGVYRAGPRPEGLGWRQLAGAWTVSAVKDFFFRGHYLALHALGQADQTYAAMLRLLDVVSRPSDYMFQRLVDNAQVGGHLRRVTLFVPLLMLLSLLATRAVPTVAGSGWFACALVACGSGLVFATKYLSFEKNAKLHHGHLSLIYLGSMALAVPLMWLPASSRLPIVSHLAALAISLCWLLYDHRRSAAPR